MFEIGVISIVVLAVGYWATLWLMGRHEDVLHGDFIHAEQGTEAAVPPPLSRSFPVKPPFPVRPKATKPSGVKPSPSGVEPDAVKPAAAETPSASPAPSSLPADRSDTLQVLLASIKRDLKDASQL
jgi:hypothetical protein